MVNQNFKNTLYIALYHQYPFNGPLKFHFHLVIKGLNLGMVF